MADYTEELAGMIANLAEIVSDLCHNGEYVNKMRAVEVKNRAEEIEESCLCDRLQFEQEEAERG